jgi:phosphonate transport system permease protein
VSGRVWRRFSPAQTAARWAGEATLAALTALMLWHVGVRWDYVADAPAQVGDLFGRMLPPEWSFSSALVRPLAQTVNIATLGTITAIVIALPVAFFAALTTTPARITYALARVIIVVSRSVDTLIWALVFIIVVGPGSLAGMLAVAMRSVGFLAKLFAEAIEEIDHGQVEAVSATGASRFQTLLYAIVPQVKPLVLGVSIYRWDINIRESTVLGLVGAGGIGFTLNEAILGLEWARVGLILLVVLVVVLLSEAVSAIARARLT